MGTRSAIIEKTENGYRGIYCHWDGYLSHNGVILQEHYQDSDKVSSLIDLGSISSLEERVVPLGPHSFDEREKETTVAYHRDRGEDYEEPVKGSTIEEVESGIDHNGYVYVFTKGKGWSVYTSTYPLGISLSKAIKKGEDE